jgi:UDP-N-acetylmuramate--alanine ligase
VTGPEGIGPEGIGPEGIGPESPGPAKADLGVVHFVGIGGVGMSGIARIMLARGYTVSGSDAKESTILAALRALGATVHVGHRADNLGAADTVVVSTAIRPSNPELAEARRRGLLVIPRAAALAAVMAGRRGVAVAGTAGKTTTTSMLTVAAQHCGVDPSFAIGGDLNESGSNAHNGSGDLFIAEADESDGSFLLLSPAAAVVTNVEVDHLDQHGTPQAYVRAFEDFLGRIGPGGFLTVGIDDPGGRRLAEVARGLPLTVRTYGTADDADLRLIGVSVRPDGTSYDAVLDGAPLASIRIGVAGHHMALNSAAALLTGLQLGLPLDPLLAGLTAFTGVRRRFEYKGMAGGVRVYDDYAHAPTKIAAQLRAARVVAGSGRLIVAFQPHLYSRTQAFGEELGTALGLADEVVVMAVYGAREDPIPGVTGAAVAAAVPLPAEQVRFEPSWSAVAPTLAATARPGDVIVTMGAGDVTMVGPEVLVELDGGVP